MAVFGLVVAGDYDAAVLEKLLRRMRPEITKVETRICGNDAKVRTTFNSSLKQFEFANSGRPVDKAIVVCDSHAGQQQQIINGFNSNFSQNNYSFPVRFAVIVPELEAWLLADHNALRTISQERGQPKDFDPLGRSPEDVSDPKKTLRKRLGMAKVAYTKMVAGRLAEISALDTIRGLCPSFTAFKTCVVDC